ncbi:MAG: cytochrome c biogenesis protein CcdA [Candidatus Cloacimonetes bacterium]|nr:cytochrome c biogenesis protein CcdA [Candidatus Cloacimonadota bacterium]
MRIKYKLLLLLALVIFVTGSLAAQSVKYTLAESNLKPGDKGVLRATLTIPEGQKQSFNPKDPEYFYLEAAHPDLSFGKVSYPKATKVVSAEEWHYQPQVTLSLPFTVKANAKPGEKQIKATIYYNLCFESGMCNPPEENEGMVKLIVSAVNAPANQHESGVTLPQEQSPEPPQNTSVIPAEAEIQNSATPAPQNASTPEPQNPSTPVPWKEVLKYILFAFIGGIILNITPCVLPILPIRIMSIMNQAQKDRSKVLKHTLIYTVGVLISFGVLAGVFIALQQAGESAGWGLQNQNPGFVIALMSVVFVFALSLLGVFEMHAPGMNAATKATSKGGYSGSFFGGIFAFLMAISCTGPFLGAALPFALKLPPALMMVFFLTLGLGFAFPFLLIGMIPKALKIIPKPGDWMVLFKELMGFVLLYIVYTQLKTLLQLTDGDYFLKVIWFMLILGFAVWLYGRFVRYEHSKVTQWIFTVLPLVLIVAAAFSYLPYKESAKPAVQQVAGEMLAAPHAPQGWYVFSEELFNKLSAEGKPVFLDIGAAWCKNCMTNEKTVLFTDGMMKEFADKGVVLLRGDFTKKDETLLAWIKKHDRAGVPFNALYIPGQPVQIFGELLTRGEISSALSKIQEIK